MSQYKLSYFNGRGKAESIRYVFHLAQQPFEDHRYKDGEWAVEKVVPGKYPFAQSPCLFMDGESFPQSSAIERLLSSKFGLNGANATETFHIDALGEHLNDIRSVYFPIRNDEAAKAKFFEEVLPKHFQLLEAYVSKVGKGWLVGNKPSLAECRVQSIYDAMGKETGFLSALESQAPTVQAIIKKFSEIPSIAKYQSERPVTTF